MKCPFCGNQDDRVIDSRLIKDGTEIRRRRECLECTRRFTSYEIIEEIQLLVIKKDNRREKFDRKKIRDGLLKACEKRPIPADVIEDIINRLETTLYRDKKEVPSRDIGEFMINELYELDEVAYVRFASVYREFKGVDQFMVELKRILDNNEEGRSDKIIRELKDKHDRPQK